MERGLLNPRDAKMGLAREIVSLYYDNDKALEAEENFKTVFQRNELPEDIEEMVVEPGILVDGKVWLPKLLTAVGLTSTNSEARRMIEQGAFKINSEKITNPDKEIEVRSGDILQMGKRKFIKIIIG